MQQAQPLPADQVMAEQTGAAQNNQPSLHSTNNNGVHNGDSSQAKGDQLVGKKRRHESAEGDAEAKKVAASQGATMPNGTAEGAPVPKKRGRKPGVKNGQKGLNQPSQT